MESLALSPEIQSLKDMLDGISTANQSTLNALGGTLTTSQTSKCGRSEKAVGAV